MFRWEDTDLERSKTEYEIEILEGLKWLGMDFEKESKMVVRQTQSAAYHKEQLHLLWDSGKIFPCPTSQDTIEAQKIEAEQKKTNFVFWSSYRDQSREALQSIIDSGESFVWRLKVPRNQVVSYKDEIRGTLEVNTETLGDFAIARADESVLYLLANVLDDWREGITHVIKGEDHISNTPKQLLLWEALEQTPPSYTHIPLVLDTQGAKLSKRKVEPGVCVLIKDFQEQGFLPQAVVNGLVFLGWHPKTEEEIFSLSELCQRFSLEGIHKGGAKYDFEKMKWFNNAWMRKIEIGELVERFLEWDKQTSNNKYQISATLTQTMLGKALNVAREKAKTFEALAEEIEYVLFPLDELDPAGFINEKMGIDADLAKKVLTVVSQMLESISEDQFTAEIIKEKSIEKIAEMGLKNGQFLSPFRYALSGRDRSMGPFDMCDIMGKEESLKRITNPSLYLK